MMRLRLLLSAAGLAVACGGDDPSLATRIPSESPPAQADGRGTIPAGDPSGDWVRAPKDHANTRFSSLDQITPESVAGLGVRMNGAPVKFRFQPKPTSAARGVVFTSFAPRYLLSPCE